MKRWFKLENDPEIVLAEVLDTRREIDEICDASIRDEAVPQHPPEQLELVEIVPDMQGIIKHIYKNGRKRAPFTLYFYLQITRTKLCQGLTAISWRISEPKESY